MEVSDEEECVISKHAGECEDGSALESEIDGLIILKKYLKNFEVVKS